MILVSAEISQEVSTTRHAIALSLSKRGNTQSMMEDEKILILSKDFSCIIAN